jgi:prephenate dehydrogenase
MPEDSSLPYQHLTVIGGGLIGGSILMAARQTQPELTIHVIDTNEATLQQLLSQGIVNRATHSLPSTLASNHLIVLAAHLDNNVAYLKRIAKLIGDDETITVTDIGSCKASICQTGKALLPKQQFIGGHPLAGKEVSGVNHATGLLFAGKPFVLCPPDNWEDDNELIGRVNTLKTFIEDTLRAHVGFQSPQHHDWAMAYVSHLPQLYAVLLTNLLAQNRPGELLSFHGAGLDGQLRLAASPYAMWEGIFSHNKSHIQEAIRGCRELLDEAEHALTTDTMANWFKQANWIHEEFHAVRRQDEPIVIDDNRSTSAE